MKSAKVAEHSKVLSVVITESLKLEVRFEVPSNAKGSHQISGKSFRSY